VIYSNSLLARDYNADALSVKDSVDVNSHFTDESASKNIEMYQGSSAAETSYYSGGSLEADGLSAKTDDDTAGIVDDVLYSSPNYTINPNEDWLNNANNVSQNPESILTLISSNYDDCGKSQKSCSFYQGINKEVCRATRVLEVDSYHKYQCFKDKYNYEVECSNELNISCSSASYTLPPTTYNSLPGFSYNNYTLGYVTPNRMGGNCGGYHYYWRFDLDSVDQVEEFRFLWGQADDRTLIYINGNLVHNYPNSGCERGGTYHSAPNINLKPYLQKGGNELLVKIIVGGLGEGRGEFRMKYKKCDQYSTNQWQKTCGDKAFDADQCSQTENICVEGPDARNIGQGVTEYHSCWKYGVKEQCIPSDYINNCQQLETLSSCTQDTSECIDQGDSQCLNYQNGYKCSSSEVAEIEDKLIYEGFFQDIITDYIDYSQCNQFDQSSYCSVTEEICTDTGRKNIDGLVINKDCWDYDRTYTCSNESPDLSDCSSLENTCSFDTQECVEKNSDDICIEYKRSYQCNNVGGDDADIAICGSQVYCKNGDCEEIDYERDTNFSKAAASLAVLDEAADDLDTSNTTTFTGSSGKCGKDLVNYSDCCKISGWGESIGGSCSTEAQTLQEQRKNKLCVYVGEYCSDEEELTGTCLKEKQSYCCFNSKIARIIHEQGRPQLGISWGSPESPNCSGFPITQLDDIDFSTVDFSELSADIMSNAQGSSMSSADIGAIVSQKVQDHYEQNQGEGNE